LSFATHFDALSQRRNWRKFVKAKLKAALKLLVNKCDQDENARFPGLDRCGGGVIP
jgi:hypothetical protein